MSRKENSRNKNYKISTVKWHNTQRHMYYLLPWSQNLEVNLHMTREQTLHNTTVRNREVDLTLQTLLTKQTFGRGLESALLCWIQGKIQCWRKNNSKKLARFWRNRFRRNSYQQVGFQGYRTHLCTHVAVRGGSSESRVNHVTCESYRKRPSSWSRRRSQRLHDPKRMCVHWSSLQDAEPCSRERRTEGLSCLISTDAAAKLVGLWDKGDKASCNLWSVLSVGLGRFGNRPS